MKGMDFENPGGSFLSICIPTCITRCEKGFYKPVSLSRSGAVDIFNSQISIGRSA